MMTGASLGLDFADNKTVEPNRNLPISQSANLPMVIQ